MQESCFRILQCCRNLPNGSSILFHQPIGQSLFDIICLIICFTDEETEAQRAHGRTYIIPKKGGLGLRGPNAKCGIFLILCVSDHVPI